MESNPASSRNTAGKSTSTPASISDVDTTRQGRPSFNRARISVNTDFRWAGYMRVDRWKAPSGFSRPYIFCALFRLLTIHRACFCSLIRSAMASQDSFPSRMNVTRWNVSRWNISWGHSSTQGHSGRNSWNILSSAGCVAVQSTAEVPYHFTSCAIAETQGRR